MRDRGGPQITKPACHRRNRQVAVKIEDLVSMRKDVDDIRAIGTLAIMQGHRAVSGEDEATQIVNATPQS